MSYVIVLHIKTGQKVVLPQDSLSKLGPTEQFRMFDLLSFFMRRKLALLNYYVSGTVLSIVHVHFLLCNLVRTLRTVDSIVPILQTRKLGLRKIKDLDQNQISRARQCQNLKSILATTLQLYKVASRAD